MIRSTFRFETAVFALHPPIALYAGDYHDRNRNRNRHDLHSGQIVWNEINVEPEDEAKCFHFRAIQSRAEVEGLKAPPSMEYAAESRRWVFKRFYRFRNWFGGRRCWRGLQEQLGSNLGEGNKINNLAVCFGLTLSG